MDTDYRITETDREVKIKGIVSIYDLYREIDRIIDTSKNELFADVNVIIYKEEPTAVNLSPPPMEPDPPWPPLNDYADQPSPCYICGSGDLKRNYRKAYYIECLNCGFTGPRSSSSIEDSQKLWNDYYMTKGGN